MKYASIAILLILISILSINCKGDSLQVVKTDNRSFDVELLFEIDGCKVYRFYDEGRSRYFTTCSGSVSWNETHGKNNIHEIDVSTQSSK